MLISEVRKPMNPVEIEDYLTQKDLVAGGKAPSLNLDKLREALSYGWDVLRVTFSMRSGPVVGEPGFDFALKEEKTGAISIVPVACGKEVVDFIKEKGLTTELEE